MRILLFPVAVIAALHASPAIAQDRERADTAAKAKADTNPLPLKPTRTVRFTTDEGTWISLDVSPDGRTLVFELVGDLYTMPIGCPTESTRGCGRATRITSGMAFDAQPRFSPDGKRIVFVSDRSGGDNLWLIDPNGKNAKALTQSDKNQYISPVWMPDGSGIVVSRNESDPYADHYELHFFHADGGSGLKLLGAPSEGSAPSGSPPAPSYTNYLGAAFGNDPRYVYVAVKRGGHGYDQTSFGWQIGTFDRETGVFDVITRASGSAMRPMPSPDGKYLVYATRRDTSTGLRLRELDSGEERWLVRHVQRDDQESRATRDLMPGAAFLRDGSALITFAHGKIWRVAVPSGTKTPIPFTADVELALGPLVKFDYPVNDSTLVVQQIRDARLSPDGSRIAFTALDRLWVSDLSGARDAVAARNGETQTLSARRLTKMDVGEFNPTWSPDGRYIAYVTWSDSGGHVYRVRSDGPGRPEQLTRGVSFYQAPAYTPTGSRIVVVKGLRSSRFEGEEIGASLVWLPAAGGPTTRIAAAPEVISTPYFVRRDTTRIYLGGMSMRFDGTDRRTHLTVSDGDPHISPDGDRAIVRAENNVYVLTMPPLANNPPAISVKSPASASVPVRRATLIGGEFLGWAPDGKSFHYSLGRSLFIYDLAAADSAIRDSTNAAARKDRPRADSTNAAARPDSAKAAPPPDSARRSKPTYEPRRYDVTITVRKDRPSGTIVLRGARVITMKGDEVIDNADLVVTNNRIASVGKRGSVPVPAGAHVFDVTSKTIIPGFVDIHWHGRLEDRQERDIHQSKLWYYWATLAWGTTTARDPQTGSTDVLAYADVIETGDMLGPRIYSTGPGLGFVGVNSLDEIRDVLRRYADFYDTKTIKEYAAGARKARQWVAMGARELKLTPTTEGYADLRKNVTQLFDGYAGNEHAYPIHPLYKDLVQLHAESGTTYTPTLLTNYGGPWGENYFFQSLNVHDDPKVRHFVPHSLIDRKALRRSAWFREDQFTLRQQAEQAAKIVAAGGRVGLGAHGQFHGLDAHWELWLIQSGGMPRHDALRVATLFGADAIGLGKDLGSLEPGKLADLLVLDKNPLDDIRHTNTIRYVMKNGRLYDSDTLDEVWPRQIKRAPLWQWEE